MNRWYRAYEGTVTDAKLAEVAMVAGCTRSVAIAAWHAVLENAACVNDGGRIDIPSRRIAAVLCEPFDVIESVMLGFETVGLVHDSAVCAWKRRQYESDSSTERSRKHRAAKRNGDATLQQRDATSPEAEAKTEAASAANAREQGVDVSALMINLCNTAGLAPPDPLKYFDKHSGYLQIVRDWLAAGADPQSLTQCVAARAASSKNRPSSLRYFDGAVRDGIAAKAQAVTESDRLIEQIRASKAKAA